MGITISRAQPEDAGRLAEVFNLSFFSDFVKYGECPGYNRTEEDMRSGMEKYIVYKILANGLIVGAILVSNLGGNTYHLAGLCVIPEYANKGIGQKAMSFLDDEFSHAVHWSLETPADKSENHYFYTKFGYRVTREFIDGKVAVSFLERDCK